MEMPLDAVVQHHLRVQVIEQTLDTADAIRRRVGVGLVMPEFGDDVEEAGVEVVEPAIRSDGRSRESDERAGREGVFGGSLGRR
mgnify:CR=1 FL=1